ncbi:MAG: hypothetical protein P4L62_01025 [Candidatus Pacebacteria bacterium]|nr:hypothetical protein [Candidatus Paceibacterota bacterium]MDR3582930.1 hypothetical protein [Candidatus Paceibacterota bacterium]
MSNAIGAEAAKLAGLQIDTLTKLRKGEVTLSEWEWFLNLTKEKRNELSGISVPAKNLNLKKFLIWLKKNELEQKLPGGLIEQIAEQEIFYRRFYGSDFRIDLKKISINPRRLPAIKAGLEAGCVNYALVKATPVLFGAQPLMTGAEFFYELIVKWLRKEDFKIWAETGTDRWTKLTLLELLQRCHPVEPEVFNGEAFKVDWAKEEIRVIDKIVPSSKVMTGIVDLVFTNDAVDIPADQTIVNKDGQIVKLSDRSYISAIEQKVRVLSQEEGIVLASQLFARDKTYLAPDTWEWRRDVIDHRDKGTSPGVSIGVSSSHVVELLLSSRDADGSFGSGRLRLAL